MPKPISICSLIALFAVLTLHSDGARAEESKNKLKIVASPFYRLVAEPAGDRGYRVSMTLLAPETGWFLTADSCEFNAKADRIDVKMTLREPEKAGTAGPTPLSVSFETGILAEGSRPMLVWWRSGQKDYAPRSLHTFTIENGECRLFAGSQFSVRPDPQKDGKLTVSVKTMSARSGYSFDKLEKSDGNTQISAHFEAFTGEDVVGHTGPRVSTTEINPGKLSRGWAMVRVMSRAEGESRDDARLVAAVLVSTNPPLMLEPPASAGDPSEAVPAATSLFANGADAPLASKGAQVNWLGTNRALALPMQIKADPETLEFQLNFRQLPGADAFKVERTRCFHDSGLIEILLAPDPDSKTEPVAQIGILVCGSYQVSLWMRNDKAVELRDCVQLSAGFEQPREGIAGFAPMPASFADLGQEFRTGRPTLKLESRDAGFTAVVSLSVNAAEELTVSRVERHAATGLIRIVLDSEMRKGGDTSRSASKDCEVDLGELAVGWYRVEIIRSTKGSGIHVSGLGFRAAP